MSIKRSDAMGRLGLLFAFGVSLVLPGLGLRAQESGTAVLPGWGQPILFCRKPEGNLALTCRWLPDRGIRLAVIARKGGAAVALELTADRLLAVDLGPDGKAAARPRPVQRYPAPALTAPHNQAELTLKFRDSDWVFYLDGELAASLAAPFEPPADICLPTRDPVTLQEKPLFRPVPREEFATDFMIEEGAPNELYPWRIESGNWHIHTALQDALVRPESDLQRIQAVPLTPDKSPNFYSLKGGGIAGKDGLPVESVLTTGYDFFDQYEYAAAMQVNRGIAGLVFYHRGEGATDFYAFTIDMGDAPEDPRSLCLWAVRRGVRRVLSRVAAPLFRDQWHRPAVRLDKDEIVCLLDGIEVMRVREPLPVGGKVGLYALAPEEIRFDDVRLAALSQVPLRNVGEIGYQALDQEGSFFWRPGFWTPGTAADRTDLLPGRRWYEQRLVVGRPHHAQTVFSAAFKPAGRRWCVGLVAGYRSPDKPYYRFTVERQASTQTYRLERVRRGGTQMLDTWERSDVPRSNDGTVRLMADATDPTRLDFLCDGRLVLMLPLEEPVTGGMGVLVGPWTATTLSDLQYGFHRERQMEQVQKNQIFQHDSFMRHWAAPEGQWIGGADGALWHKGDFFSDYSIRLPCIPGSVLTVGVPDGESEGPVSVAVGPQSITLRVKEAGRPEPLVYEQTVPVPAGSDLTAVDYDFHHEGWWCWVAVDGKVLARHRLTADPVGTRCLVKGMTLGHMARSRATRANVIDDFFSESPHQWIVNGGTWQIINRFQCTPSWSHMAGESNDGMAALWHKTEFGGDIVVEFYAGTRMGWYDRPGDLNCTVMADTTSPSRGYTVTDCEYDENLSQNWSTLYRNGQVLARSDLYTVPRRRAGMVRKYMDPLIAEGRPIHGAWYYIKLRKIGRKLEYYFDNQLVFSTEDPQALRQGLVGIWTFIHSMTLAQVKITFQEAHPRPFPVKRLVPGAAPAPPAAPAAPAAAPAPSPLSAITANGFPLDSLAPSRWSVSDSVGHARLEPFRLNASGLRLTNRLGSGAMLLKPDLPPLPLHQVAGWRIGLRRTPGARFNLYYSIGTVDANGAYTPQRQCFHLLSGSDFADGAYACTGETAVPPTERVDRPGGEWQTVTAWIPTCERTPQDEARHLMVRLEGLGELQPGRLLCGLGGNAPGDAYAVRELVPVLYGLPAVSVPAVSPPLRFAVRDTPEGDLRGETRGEKPAEELAALLKGMSHDGLNTAAVRAFDRQGNASHYTLAWIQLPAAPPVTLGWDPERPDTLRLEHHGGYPDPRLAGAALSLGGAALPLEPLRWQEVRLARLPRGAARTAPDLAVSLALAGTTAEHRLSSAAQPHNAGPVLLAVDGLKSFCLGFEGPDTTPLGLTADGRMTVRQDDPVQGRYLEVRNRELEQRLSASCEIGFSVAEFPIMQLRYRAFDMTHVTATFQNYHYIRLNDDYASAVAVRLAHDLKLDETWHTWTGIVADGFNQQPFSVARFTPQGLTLGSAGSPDQTGRYSHWHLDDIVFGPAVAKPEQLAFTPRYDDGDGVKAVFAAIAAAETAYDLMTPTDRQALTWLAHDPGQPLALSFAGLQDGVHHLLLRATDNRGAGSAVTDIPFMLDTQPLQVTTAFGPLADPAGNGVQLGVSFANQGGAPWAIERASFSVAGTKQQIPAWTSLFVHDAQADRLVLNYPLICRARLDAAANGDVIEFAIDDIVDGAGNPTPKVTVPVKVDYTSDTAGPAWYYLQFESSVHWWWNWDGYRNTTAAFSPGQYNQVDVVHNAGESPYLQHLTYHSTGDLSRTVTWKPVDHPWLSFRIRQPQFKARRHVQVALALTTTDNRTYTLSLSRPGSGATELNRSLQIDWSAERWHRLAFNVRDLMKAAGVTDAVLANTVISTITLQRRGTQHQEPVLLDDVFVHGPAASAGKPDPLQWYAYDASGVDSLQAECVADNDQVQWAATLPRTGADLNALRAKMTGGHAWFRCSAKDKAGKLSVPFWLPLAK